MGADEGELGGGVGGATARGRRRAEGGGAAESEGMDLGIWFGSRILWLGSPPILQLHFKLGPG